MRYSKTVSDEEYFDGFEDLTDDQKDFYKKEKESIEKTLANTSVSDYNRRGWARPLFTIEDMSKIYNLLAGYETYNKSRSDVKLKDGTKVLEVNNKIVFASGSVTNPTFKYVIVFDAETAQKANFYRDLLFGFTPYSQMDISDIRDLLYESEGKYERIYGFDERDYKAFSKNEYTAKLLNEDTNGFGDFGQFIVRGGVYSQDEGSISGSVQGRGKVKTSRTVSDEEASALRKENTDLKRKLKEAEKRAESEKRKTEKGKRGRFCVPFWYVFSAFRSGFTLPLPFSSPAPSFAAP